MNNDEFAFKDAERMADSIGMLGAFWKNVERELSERSLAMPEMVTDDKLREIARNNPAVWRAALKDVLIDAAAEL
jgi:hypothetical protein